MDKMVEQEAKIPRLEKKVISFPDYYVTHESELKQPKKEIGDYIESQGIAVAKRFSGLKDALDSGSDIILRDESRGSANKDYSGGSGVFESFVARREDIETERQEFVGLSPHQIDEMIGRNFKQFFDEGQPYDLKDLLAKQIISQLKRIGQKESGQNKIELYLKSLFNKRIIELSELNGLDQREVFKNLSFSYWEFLEGWNRTIFQDNVGRYHVFTRDTFNQDHVGYTIVDGKEFVHNTDFSKKRDSENSIKATVKMYEDVRNLERFNKRHNYIMEIQSTTENSAGDTPLFLQIHRGADSIPSTHTLNREPREGEIEAFLAFRSTPPDGIVTEINLVPLFNKNGMSSSKLARELSLRGMPVLVAMNYGPEGIATSAMGGSGGNHGTISELAKTGATVVVNPNLLFRAFHTEEEISARDTAINRALRKVRVVSDGRRAFIQPIED